MVLSLSEPLTLRDLIGGALADTNRALRDPRHLDDALAAMDRIRRAEDRGVVVPVHIRNELRQVRYSLMRAGDRPAEDGLHGSTYTHLKSASAHLQSALTLLASV